MQRRNLLKLLQFYKFMPFSPLLQTTVRKLLCCRTMATKPLEVTEDLYTPVICYWTLTQSANICALSVYKKLISVFTGESHMTILISWALDVRWVLSHGLGFRAVHVRNTFCLNKQCSFANVCKMSCKRATKRFSEEKKYPASTLLCKTNNTQNSGNFHVRGSVLDKHKN